MKIAGLVVSLLFVVSSALQADSTSVLSADFNKDINISQMMEKVSAQDVNIVPVVAKTENKYGYESNEPDSIDDAARMLDDAIHKLGVSAKVIVHESEPPFIKAAIGPLTGGQYSKMIKLFSRDGESFLYYGYKVQLNIFAIRNKSQEPDSIDHAARMLDDAIHRLGVSAKVIVHESEPPFIKASIGDINNVQRKNMMKLFTYENGDTLYFGYKVQLKVIVGNNSSEPDSIDHATRMLDEAIGRLGLSAEVIVHESEPPFIKVKLITGDFNNEQFKKALNLFVFEDGSVFYFGYKVQLNITIVEDVLN